MLRPADLGPLQELQRNGIRGLLVASHPSTEKPFTAADLSAEMDSMPMHKDDIKTG
jgi:hypothetical protein